ncbi:unnamed protein product, partial [Staurois parvus]
HRVSAKDSPAAPGNHRVKLTGKRPVPVYKHSTADMHVYMVKHTAHYLTVNPFDRPRC